MRFSMLLLSMTTLMAGADLSVFEVASVKPSPPGAGSYISSGGGPGTKAPGTWSCTSMSLGNIAMLAFDLRSMKFLVAPDWMNDRRFDIMAKVPPGATTRAQLRLMIQNLLTDRFGMKFHREDRQSPGYRMVIAKNGPRFKESAPVRLPDPAGPEGQTPRAATPPGVGPDGFPTVPPGSSGVRCAGNRCRGRWLRTSMQKFATVLSGILDTPVSDATDLNGDFDLDLYWDSSSMVETGAGGPWVFDALGTQLGLKLEPRRVTVSFVVIDHAEMQPTEN